jgi:hypothetical protein
MSKPSSSRVAAAAVLSGVLAGLPLAAAAQVFKCKQPDGSTTFQQSPCLGALKAPVAPATPASDTASQPVAKPRSAKSEPYFDPYAPETVRQRAADVPLPAAHPNPSALPAPVRPQPAAEPAAASEPAPPASAADQKLLQKQQEQLQQAARENERIKAQNRALACSHARQQLVAANSGRPIYSIDDKGERHYVADKDRKQYTDAAQQRVNAECQ